MISMKQGTALTNVMTRLDLGAFWIIREGLSSSTGCFEPHADAGCLVPLPGQQPWTSRCCSFQCHVPHSCTGCWTPASRPSSSTTGVTSSSPCKYLIMCIVASSVALCQLLSCVALPLCAVAHNFHCYSSQVIRWPLNSEIACFHSYGPEVI